ncbi:hypothetical protein V9T40_014079 [Parthenolecanium corni]|uniref:Kinesin-like protein KIF13A n=1 Tax=Parthenolecanium corni TaxID=536013 RepID=A0AAN9TDU8_9HEMI
MASDKIKVAVRVRPFNRRELEMDTQCIVEMKDRQTVLHQPITSDKNERKSPKSFTFDFCFDSIDARSNQFVDQETVFKCVGEDILDNAFQGYNACVFAYGQTGSGKTYTMMGSNENKGIIPRLCDALFDRIAMKENTELTFKVEVSYMEIYNEKVRDLLDPNANKQSLKVREHNVLGPYVDGLSQLAVTSFEDIDKLMTEGNKSRTVAATNMNSESSRSHAVFSIILTQILTDVKSGVCGEKVSRMSLVDLAGSERAVKTGAIGERLKEGSNINKSLTTLGLVISKLADQSNLKNKDKFVPYRDSVLTWLLKDNLGGNSRTVMVATISPAADNYEETLSTLRYADRAKRIVNHAVVNEDPNARIIRELRQEVEALREMLAHATGSSTQREHLHEKLSESEKLMKEMSQTWEEKLIKTERLQHERHEALENMGISVQSSGIMVEKSKYYLVNLNADPSLNEMLVYYLKYKTLVGSEKGDIILSGLGIQGEHCIITIEEDGLFMEPMPNARCYINGVVINSKALLKHGDRILWGNHHFFRVNCPKSVLSEPPTPAQPLDYNFAREEFMLNELSNDPIQTAIAKMEKQHEEDKQVALEKQRQEYERQFQHLRSILSPSTPFSPYSSYDPLRMGKLTPCTPTSQMRVEKWAHDRDEMFRKSITRLKEDIVTANSLVQEANYLAEEMGKQVKYSVTLQIPPANLSPNRKRRTFVSEPAILVKRKGNGSQVWSMEKLDTKLVDMREMFNEYKRGFNDPQCLENMNQSLDPFFENQANHNLIGVANVFLEVLFHDVALDYQTPIINQQGEVTGRLQVEIGRINGTFPQDRICEAASESSGSSEPTEHAEDDNISNSSEITVKVKVKQASGLPPSLSRLVFCQYSFWGVDDSIVIPSINPCDLGGSYKDSIIFRFDHTSTFTVPVTEEFIEHCAEGALSIEVWGHRSASHKSKPAWVVEQTQLAKARSLADRWSELTRKIELWIEIQELNDQGEYAPVEVSVTNNNILTGGVYQLRQGQQRRIKISVKPVQNSGTLPIICDSITNIAVGSIINRNRLQKPLDSYQDEDLNTLREKWSDALMRRRQYLDQQIQNLLNKPNKNEQDVEREQSLVEQWVSLTEERNAVLVPAAGSGIPGAPADWIPPVDMEPHIPVLFLNLNGDDLSTMNNPLCEIRDLPVAGVNSILSKEHGKNFYNLPIIKYFEKDVCAIAAWDSSVHDSVHLNKVTDSNERVYLILKATVRLSHPAPMDLILRKRLCIVIYKRQSLTDRIIKRIVKSDYVTKTGVTYEIVSNIPKASEELEERESLAQIAASGENTSLSDGETYIEKYTKSVSAVESILTLDKLRQSVAVKERLLAQGSNNTSYQNVSMRKTASVPNFSQLMRFDSFDFLSPVVGKAISKSESVMDLNSETKPDAKVKKTKPECDLMPAKPFGSIARPTYLNLNVNLNSIRLQSGLKCSPNAKLGFRMTTLHEEHYGGTISENDLIPEEVENEECVDSKLSKTPVKPQKLNLFSTNSINEMPAEPIHQTVDEDTKGYKYSADASLSDSETIHDFVHEKGPTQLQTPGTSSSGYISEAFSTSNLTNDDSLSIKSNTGELTPDKELDASNEPSVTDENTFELNDEKVDLETIVMDESMSTTDGDTFAAEETVPDWIVIGESVLIRPYNTSGVISFIGNTDFAGGTWIGVELDTPTGKNDGTVKGIKYFEAKPKHGIFVRVDKLIQDRRGRAMRMSLYDKSQKGETLSRSRAKSKSTSRLVK